MSNNSEIPSFDFAQEHSGLEEEAGLERIRELLFPQNIDDLPTFSEAYELTRKNRFARSTDEFQTRAPDESYDNFISRLPAVDSALFRPGIFLRKDSEVFQGAYEGSWHFEVWTREGLSLLTDRIVATVDDRNIASPRILEVGAGTGRLSGLLQQSLSRRSDNFEVIAADNRAYRHMDIQPESFVEDMDSEYAIRHFRPDIVLISWMPSGLDWTKTARETASVVEYILVGKATLGTTGEIQRTWGDLHEREGFTRQRLDKLSDHLVSYIDGSEAYSFTRQN